METFLAIEETYEPQSNLEEKFNPRISKDASYSRTNLSIFKRCQNLQYAEIFWIYQVARDLLKALTVRASVVDQEELKICWKLEKRPYFSR